MNRVVNICQQTITARIKDSTIKRCVSNSSQSNRNDLGIDTKSYKPSTAKTETHVPDDLKGGQSIETIDTTSKTTATLTGGGKVWYVLNYMFIFALYNQSNILRSVQNPGSVHIAPLGAATTTFIPTQHGDGKTIHETTVHTTQGELNIADPFKTHTLQPEATTEKLAEAAAASAFETFAPNTPLTSPPATDTVFAPKISATEVYSAASSPTAQFENVTPSLTTDATTYETTMKSKVFGGHDTIASTKKHSKDDPFATKQTNKTR